MLLHTYPISPLSPEIRPVPDLLPYTAALPQHASTVEPLLASMLLCQGESEKQLRVFRLTVNHLATRADSVLHPVATDMAELRKTPCELELTRCRDAEIQTLLAPVSHGPDLSSIPQIPRFDTPTEHETPQRNGRSLFQMEVRCNAAA